MLSFGCLEVYVLSEKKYCRYGCEDYYICKRRQHRGGIWYKILIYNPVWKRGAIMLIGQGEYEDNFCGFDRYLGEYKWSGMSGCTQYTKGYQTCGGWRTLYTPILIKTVNKEIARIIEPKVEDVTFAKILDDHKVGILKELIKNDITTTEHYWGIWDAVKPLLKIYASERFLFLPQGAEIDFVKNSFRAIFKLNSIEFNIPKVSRYDIYHNGKFGFVEVRITDRKGIFYQHNPTEKKSTVYYIVEDTAIGNEQYGSIVHQPCRIALPSDNTKLFITFLMLNRLGDIVFVPSIYQDYEEFKYLLPAEQEQFDKVKVLKGEVKKEDNKYYVETETVLYHPEHGTVTLQPNSRLIAFKVPYIRRGHE